MSLLKRKAKPPVLPCSATLRGKWPRDYAFDIIDNCHTPEAIDEAMCLVPLEFQDIVETYIAITRAMAVSRLAHEICAYPSKATRAAALERVPEKHREAVKEVVVAMFSRRKRGE